VVTTVTTVEPKAQQTMRSELVSWEQFRTLARQLALLVRSSGFKPDMIVAIGRGGYMPARVLSDYLDIYNLSGFKIEHYRRAQKQVQARVRYPLSAARGHRTGECCGMADIVIRAGADRAEQFFFCAASSQRYGQAVA